MSQKVLTLRNVPNDVYQKVLNKKVQLIQETGRANVSMTEATYKLIREA